MTPIGFSDELQEFGDNAQSALGLDAAAHTEGVEEEEEVTMDDAIGGLEALSSHKRPHSTYYNHNASVVPTEQGMTSVVEKSGSTRMARPVSVAGASLEAKETFECAPAAGNIRVGNGEQAGPANMPSLWTGRMAPGRLNGTRAGAEGLARTFGADSSRSHGTTAHGSNDADGAVDDVHRMVMEVATGLDDPGSETGSKT